MNTVGEMHCPCAAASARSLSAKSRTTPYMAVVLP